MILCPKKQTQSYVLMSKKPRAAKHNLMFLCKKLMFLCLKKHAQPNTISCSYVKNLCSYV